MVSFNWIDKQDGIDDVLAEDINSIAHVVQENVKNIENLSNNKADVNEIPTKVSDLENDNGYLVASDIEGKANKTKKVVFNDIHPLELADNTVYYAEEISQLYIEYPEGDFMCSLTFTLSNIDGVDVTVVLPESRYIGGVPTFNYGETWELNIKNGVVVGGLIE